MNEARHKRTNTVRSHLYEISPICKSLEAESSLAIARGLGKGEIAALLLNSLWEGDNVLEIDGGDGCTSLGVY